MLIPTLVLQDYTKGFILSYFYRPLWALPLSRHVVEFSLRPLYPTMIGDSFQIYGVQITEKFIC